MRLDPDPLNRHQADASPCEPDTTDCFSWDLRSVWIDPGLLADTFVLLSIPAFVAVSVIVSGLGRFGVNEIWSFMLAMPICLSAWYYIVGLWIDHRKNSGASEPQRGKDIASESLIQ